MTGGCVFHVDNYVGTYQMQDWNGDKYIVSKEHIGDKENLLKKSTVFQLKRGDAEYLSLQLANIDPQDDAAILKFCNKYGLPCSNQTIQEIIPGYSIEGQSVSAREYAGYNPMYQQDHMCVEEFQRFILLAKSILGLKQALDSVEKDPAALIPHFVYLLLISREHLYDYDGTDTMSQYPTLRFQYLFQMRRTVNYIDFDAPLTKAVHMFLQFLSDPPSPTSDEPAFVLLANDMQSPIWQRLISILEQIFVSSQNFVEDIDGNGTLKFENEINFSGDIDELFNLAKLILCENINEGCTQVVPRLTINDSKVCGDWYAPYLYLGIFFEVFWMLSSESLVRRCADPTCNKFFPLDSHRFDKKYCCTTCALRVAKRNQRLRGKREKLEAQKRKSNAAVKL